MLHSGRSIRNNNITHLAVLMFHPANGLRNETEYTTQPTLVHFVCV